MVEAKHLKWKHICTEFLTKTNGLNLPVQRLAVQMIRDFDAIPIARNAPASASSARSGEYAPAANLPVDLLEQGRQPLFPT